MSADLLQSWFRKWVSSQPATTLFEVGNPTTCPIACFLKSRGAPAPMVESTAFTLDYKSAGLTSVQLRLGHYDKTTSVRKMPQWAQSFVETFDAAYNREDCVGRDIVLSVLDNP